MPEEVLPPPERPLRLEAPAPRPGGRKVGATTDVRRAGCQCPRAACPAAHSARQRRPSSCCCSPPASHHQPRRYTCMDAGAAPPLTLPGRGSAPAPAAGSRGTALCGPGSATPRSAGCGPCRSHSTHWGLGGGVGLGSGGGQPGGRWLTASRPAGSPLSGAYTDNRRPGAGPHRHAHGVRRHANVAKPRTASCKQQAPTHCWSGKHPSAGQAPPGPAPRS